RLCRGRAVVAIGGAGLALLAVGLAFRQSGGRGGGYLRGGALVVVFVVGGVGRGLFASLRWFGLGRRFGLGALVRGGAHGGRGGVDRFEALFERGHFVERFLARAAQLGRQANAAGGAGGGGRLDEHPRLAVGHAEAEQ